MVFPSASFASRHKIIKPITSTYGHDAERRQADHTNFGCSTSNRTSTPVYPSPHLTQEMTFIQSLSRSEEPSPTPQSCEPSLAVERLSSEQADLANARVRLDIPASFLSGLPLWNTGLSSSDLWRHFVPSLACVPRWSLAPTSSFTRRIWLATSLGHGSGPSTSSLRTSLATMASKSIPSEFLWREVLRGTAAVKLAAPLLVCGRRGDAPADSLDEESRFTATVSLLYTAVHGYDGLVVARWVGGLWLWPSLLARC